MYPAVKNYDSLSPELFEEYFKKWPEKLNHIPKEVIESWIYRHWSDFQDWIPLQPEKWKYELCEFNNDQILEIDHVEENKEDTHKIKKTPIVKDNNKTP